MRTWHRVTPSWKSWIFGILRTGSTLAFIPKDGLYFIMAPPTLVRHSMLSMNSSRSLVTKREYIWLLSDC